MDSNWVHLSVLADECERSVTRCDKNIAEPLPTTAMEATAGSRQGVLPEHQHSPAICCHPARTFSALGLMKNHMRATTEEDRLSGLAHPHINMDLD